MSLTLIALYITYSILGTAVLWVFFLATMALKAANDAGNIPSFIKPAAYALIGVGLVIDFLVNVFVASFLFLELPTELTVTARVSRHEHHGEGWRQVLATWICKNLLDPFSVGGHCN
jgi:hypothetical protein